MVLPKPKPDVRTEPANAFDDAYCDTRMSTAYALALAAIDQALIMLSAEDVLDDTSEAASHLAYNLTVTLRHSKTLPEIVRLSIMRAHALVASLRKVA